MINNKTIIERIKETEKVIIVTQDSHLDDETEDFIKSIKTAVESKTLIPVVCEDMFEYEDPITHEWQTLHSYLVEQVFKHCRYALDLSEAELHDIVNEGYYGMRLLENKSLHKLIGDRPFYKCLYTSVMDNQKVASNIHLKKEVKDFLETCNFPLIITTSCFGIIEKELGLNYQNQGKASSLNTKNEEILPSKCVYHIFGKASFSHPNWGYSDVQILDYLRSALGDRPWSNLTSAINGKSLFVLGNDSPDWLFRFILTPIFGSSV